MKNVYPRLVKSLRYERDTSHKVGGGGNCYAEWLIDISGPFCPILRHAHQLGNTAHRHADSISNLLGLPTKFNVDYQRRMVTITVQITEEELTFIIRKEYRRSIGL